MKKLLPLCRRPPVFYQTSAIIFPSGLDFVLGLTTTSEEED
jgi:hypothetical protein